MDPFFLSDNPGGHSRSVAIQPGLSLAQHVFLAGAFAGKALCSGAGRCGLCRVRFADKAPPALAGDAALIAPERLERGFRLSCLRPPVPGATVEAAVEPVRAAARCYPARDPEAVLGVDLGTTAVKWRLVRQGLTLAQGGGLNPQLGAGSDVMSRLALARHPQGAERLKAVVADCLRNILEGLPALPGAVGLTGNPAMVCLALGLDGSGLAAAPYRLDFRGGASAGLAEDLPQAYIPPLWAPFVGADVSAGLAALMLSPTPPPLPLLLADLGTNGEFALMTGPDRVFVASVPMGPALEGVGMGCGVMAGPGAAVAFSAAPSGILPVLHGHSVPGGAARGISGTGYMSLLALLRSLGVLTAAGQFAARPATPLAAKVLAGLDSSAGEPRLGLGGLSLAAADVEALLTVKAAFNAAVRLLLDAAGLTFPALASLCLAGALGENVAVADLETLGFLPPGSRTKVRAVGNTSLDGACLLAADLRARQWTMDLGPGVRPVEIVSRPEFQRIFIDSMRFDHV